MPREVREWERLPTEREKLARDLMIFWAISENGLNENTNADLRRKKQLAERLLDESFAEKRKAHEHASAQARAEVEVIERLSREQLVVFDMFQRPTTFPTTRASWEDMRRRVEALPAFLDRWEARKAEIEYHEERRELLDQIHELGRKLQAKDDPQLRRQLDAARRLLAAMDESHAAGLSATRPTLGPTTRQRAGAR